MTAPWSKPGWTPEQIEQLKCLNDGRSSGQIAREIGISRSAVIGKMMRLGIKLKTTQSAKRTGSPTNRKASPTPVHPRYNPVAVDPIPLRPDAWSPLQGATPIALADLEPHHCRWPVHGGSCGCSKVAGLPYCETHAALAYRPFEPIRQDKTRAPALGIRAIDAAREMESAT